MPDQWNPQNTPEETAAPVSEPVPAPSEQTPTEEPVTPVAPVTPPAVSYQPPHPPYERGYYGSGSSSAPTEEHPQPTSSVWVKLLAVVGALALLIGLFGGTYYFVKHSSLFNNPAEGEEITAPDDAQQIQNAGGDHEYNENAPVLQIDTWDTNDGGLSTEEIVNLNYDSTVVLTAYSKTNNFYFGESNLEEAGGSTGIVMTKDGYIVTNRHCVVNESTGQPFDRVDVTTYDGTTYEGATIVGVDESTDLAVIKIKATNLTPAKFGDSDKLAVGARVVALGNAAGLSWTATQGIVSAKARDVYDDTGYAIKCLQVDLAINYGNSGGPLLNAGAGGGH